MFEVKFGTPKPILIRECFEMNGFYCDLDLAARFAGRCEVLEYDGTRYEDEKAVDAAIKSNATQILEKCYNEDWPEGTPKAWNNFPGIEEYFDKELGNYGIKGHTVFFSKNLTPDSEELLKEWRDKAINKSADILWDRGKFDNVMPGSGNGRFQVKFSSPFMHAKGGQVFYAPGEAVEVEYTAVASDTSYTFNVNAPDVKYKYGSTIKINFTMPEHEVMISMGITPYGPPLDLQEKSLKMWIEKNMGTCGSGKIITGNIHGNIDITAAEWICPNCKAKNNGKFCSDCGTARTN